MKKLEGWGKQSILNLKYSIENRKKISFEKFIFSLGIRHIGLENAKLLAKNIGTSKNFLDLSKSKKFNDLLNIDGIGETQINSIKNFFSNQTNLKVIGSLVSILKIDSSVILNKNGPLKNKTFMLTGKLKNMSRAEAKSLIEKNSGSIISNVSKKLDFLIIGENPTKRKVDNAKELNIKILDQNSWLKMLN